MSNRWPRSVTRIWVPVIQTKGLLCCHWYHSLLQVKGFVTHFWTTIPSHISSVLYHDKVIKVIRYCDTILYSSITNVLMPGVIQPLPARWETFGYESVLQYNNGALHGGRSGGVPHSVSHIDRGGEPQPKWPSRRLWRSCILSNIVVLEPGNGGLRGRNMY
jgi:hypothetical protein